MKKSTIMLFMLTIVGLILSCVLFQLEGNINWNINSRTVNHLYFGKYILPFIGLIYWIFSKNIE